MITNLFFDALYYTVGGTANVLNRLPTASFPVSISNAFDTVHSYFVMLNVWLPVGQIAVILAFAVVVMTVFVVYKLVVTITKFIPFIG